LKLLSAVKMADSLANLKSSLLVINPILTQHKAGDWIGLTNQKTKFVIQRPEQLANIPIPIDLKTTSTVILHDLMEYVRSNISKSVPQYEELQGAINANTRFNLGRFRVHENNSI